MDPKTTVDFLVLDDDEKFRSRLRRALSDRGFVTLAAGNVTEALQLLAEHDIRRAITDLRMPHENGLEFLRFVAEHHPNLSTIVLTGYGSISTATESMKLGAIHYLTKPVTIEQILSAFEGDIRTTEVPVPSLSQVEWDHIQRVVDEYEGNISHAAKALGVHRRSLQRKLQKSPGVVR